MKLLEDLLGVLQHYCTFSPKPLLGEFVSNGTCEFQKNGMGDFSYYGTVDLWTY